MSQKVKELTGINGVSQASVKELAVFNARLVFNEALKLCLTNKGILHRYSLFDFIHDSHSL